MDNKELTAAMEEYLQVIYALENKDRVARVSAVGREMKVKKASVVAAIRYLKKKGMINQERYGYITMTEEGKKAAQAAMQKYEKLALFLEKTLKYESEQARKEAKRASYYLSSETTDKLEHLIPKNNEKSRVKKQKGGKWKK